RIFFDLPAAFIAELVLTALFVIVILGVTTKAASKAQAALGIGLMLTLIHLISIPITNTSVNPARSLGPALFELGTGLGQLWRFIRAPVAGGALGSVVWKLATGRDETQTGESEAQGVELTCPPPPVLFVVSHPQGCETTNRTGVWGEACGFL